MLASCYLFPTIPAHDLNRARRFYEQKLGLIPTEELGDGLLYECAGNSQFFLYETGAAGTAQNTAMSWLTDDIEAEVAELRSKGVVFEEYDFPGLKTVNGIADLNGERSAWFKDSEGNILAISQTI